jgi:SAM-dependent methyltransferase
MPGRCLGCGSDRAHVVLDLGPQPPSNRFLRSAGEAAPVHPLRVAQCECCGLVQLADPMPVDMVRSRFEWLTYNEPEGHLDRLVDRLAERMAAQACDGLAWRAGPPDVLGVTYKDDSTLARLARRGLGGTRRLDPAADLDVHDPLASLETFQQALTPARARALAERHGRADVVVARHILEHAHDPAAFLDACCELARPGGLVVFEVPDSSTFLEACDYSFLWEEHVCYFTPATLQALLAARGLQAVETLVYPYALEHSINAIVVNRRGVAHAPAADQAELARGRRFAQGFERRRADCRRAIEALKVGGARVAAFGAGHLAAKFVNFNGVADLLDGVVDDNPNKQHLFMPGSRLPIVGSSLLADASLGACLMSLSPESEQKVVAAQKPFVARGGLLLSMFACSPRSLEGHARRAGEAG